MPPERFPPDDPREWLVRARSNLVRARTALPGVLLEDLCFDAQQAAEKALKAVLVGRGVAFPYTHDIGHLLDLVRGSGIALPAEVDRADTLTRFAVLTRYPGVETVSEAEHAEAVSVAEAVVEWAARYLAGY